MIYSDVIAAGINSFVIGLRQILLITRCNTRRQLIYYLLTYLPNAYYEIFVFPIGVFGRPCMLTQASGVNRLGTWSVLQVTSKIAV